MQPAVFETLVMVTIDKFRQLALAFPGTQVLPHFELESFRLGKKIFATFHEKTNRAMLSLSLPDEYVYCSYDASIFYPVSGGWGKKGATFVELSKVKQTIFKEALTCAYNSIAGKSKKLP